MTVIRNPLSAICRSILNRGFKVVLQVPLPRSCPHRFTIQNATPGLELVLMDSILTVCLNCYRQTNPVDGYFIGLSQAHLRSIDSDLY